MAAEDPSAQHVADTLIVEGAEPLKALAPPEGANAGNTLEVGAYAVRFSDAREKDLAGEYFTKGTDFGPRAGDGVVTMFNHGMCPAPGLEEVCEQTFGPVKVKRDDVGLFVSTCLDLADKYQAGIATLVKQGKLKWSSGTAKHVERKNADGEITRWHPVEFSFTPQPCEPRLPGIRPLKSLALDGDAAAEVAAAFRPVDSPATAASPERTPSHSISMTEAEKAAAVKSATDLRIAEINEITATGERFNCREDARGHIVAGKSLQEFNAFVLEKVGKAQPVVTDPKIGMNRKEIGAYSVVKAIREWMTGGNASAITGLEKEASVATAKSIQRDPQGFYIPHDVAGTGLQESHELGAEAIKTVLHAFKTLNQTTFSQGGALVGTNVLTDSIIELLRNKPLVAQMGAMTLTGLVGNVAVPMVNGGAIAYWLNEQGSVTPSDQSFGQLGFTPKRLAGRTGYTKELINQTTLSVEALVRNDITTQLAIAKDLAALVGTGGAQPLGIANTTGINSVTFGATATRAKMIEFQQKVATANASRGNLAYMTTPAVAAKLMNVPEQPSFPKFIWDGNVDSGVVVGRRAEATNQVPNDRVIYGNWNDLMLLDWAGIDVVVNPYTLDAQGIVTITITLWTDSGVRHAVSFAVSTDSGAQ